MITFIIRRLIYGFLVLLGVVIIVFLLFNVLPGDPARMIMGQRADENSIKIIRKDLGLDQPLYIQFIMYINDLSPLSIHNYKDDKSFLYLDPNKYEFKELFHFADNKVLVLKYPYLRRSYQSKRKVTAIIADTLPETAVLAITSIVIASFLGILLGIISAIKKGTWIDNISMVFAVLGMSGPSFFTGILISWVFGYLLSDITHLNMTGSLFSIDDYTGEEYLNLSNLILPAITLGIRPLAIVVQLTRGSLLDVLTQDYIRTAKSKGLSYYKIIFKHALKNALTPVITTISGWFAALLAGAVFVEYIFAWKGIGSEIVNALEKYDFPVLMGSVLVIASFFVIINILVDIIYGILDPRVRVK